MIASQVLEACGQTSHWGMIAGAVVTACGKAGHIVAMIYPQPPTPPKAGQPA